MPQMCNIVHSFNLFAIYFNNWWLIIVFFSFKNNKMAFIVKYYIIYLSIFYTYSKQMFKASTLGTRSLKSSAYADAPAYTLPIQQPTSLAINSEIRPSIYTQKYIGEMTPPCLTSLLTVKLSE